MQNRYDSPNVNTASPHHSQGKISHTHYNADPMITPTHYR